MMSRFVKDTSSCGGEGSAKGSSASEGPSQPSNHLDHEIAHLTKLGSEPHELLTRAAPGRSKLPISTVEMLVARDTNHSGRGSHIRIYNVNKGWKVQKDILAKSLRWTITDTSLSPEQQYLVYASMSPMVHVRGTNLSPIRYCPLWEWAKGRCHPHGFAQSHVRERRLPPLPYKH